MFNTHSLAILQKAEQTKTESLQAILYYRGK